MTNIIAIETGAEANAKTELAAADQAFNEAKALIIDGPEMAEIASAELSQIKARIKQINDTRLSMTRPLDESKKRIMDLFRPALERLEIAENTIKTGIADWTTRERQRVAEEQRKADELRRAEEARLKAEADAKLREAETLAKSDAPAAMAALEEAQELQAQADTAIFMAPAVAAPAKISGVSVGETYKAECTDLMALVKAVASGQASIELLEANTKELNKRAKALGREFVVPGVRVWAEARVSSRGAKNGI